MHLNEDSSQEDDKNEHNEMLQAAFNIPSTTQSSDPIPEELNIENIDILDEEMHRNSNLIADSSI